jgi:hypothetical protein
MRPTREIADRRMRKRMLESPRLGQGRLIIDSQDALRLTSDELLRDLDALTQLEEEKRQTPEGDPRLVEIATRVQQLAQRVLEHSRHQVALTHSVNHQVVSGETPAGTTIAGARRNVNDILAEWRAAERQAQTAEPDSVAAIEARARADRLRDEYREAFDAAKATGR